MLTGENGILKQSTNAKETNNKAEFEEQVKLAVMASRTNDTGKINLNDLYTELKNINGATISKEEKELEDGDAALPWTVTKGGHSVIINGDGEDDPEGDTGGETKTTLLSLVKSDPAGIYGKKVSGYTANGVSDWRIFYNDNDYVYLITTDYVESSKAIACNSTMSNINGQTTYKYKAWWNDPPSTVDTTNHLSRFSPVTTETMAWEGDYSTNDNGRCVSTLLDTSNWSAFVNPTYANAAIGSPTLNMWIASWNIKYPTEKLYCNNSTTKGYHIGNSSIPETYWYNNYTSTGYNVDEADNMYYPHKSEIDGCGGYWLASPCAENTIYVMNVYLYGDISRLNYYYYMYYALRPVVCLNSNVTTSSTLSDSVIVLDN